MILAAVGFGLAEIVAGVLPSYVAFAVWTPVIGIASLTMITSANATFQMSVAPEMRGRVMALYMAIFAGGTPIGAPLVGAVADAFGPRWAIVVGAAFTALPPAQEWAELLLGIPAIAATYLFVLWRYAFTPADRALFGGVPGAEEATLPNLGAPVR